MKSAFDCKHVKSVTAWGLLYQGVEAGRVVANYSDNPCGSVCTVTISIWFGPLQANGASGRAGGCGYDKFSAAFQEALDRLLKSIKPNPFLIPEGKNLHGRGAAEVERYLISLGYLVIKVLS